MAKVCKAKTQSGKACKMKPLKDSDYCFTHDPANGIERAKAHKKGGENHFTPHYADDTQLPKEISTLEDAHKILSYTMTEVIGMDNSIARARVLLSLFDSFIKSIEIGELEKRLQALEVLNKDK